jgi:hypothetical protein
MALFKSVLKEPGGLADVMAAMEAFGPYWLLPPESERPSFIDGRREAEISSLFLEACRNVKPFPWVGVTEYPNP